MTSYYYAVKALLDNNIHSLPITADVLEEILKARGWNFVSFNLQNSESAKELERLGVLEYAQKFECFSYKQHGYKIVFYKQGMSSFEKTFAFAHELGHDCSGHFSDTGVLGHHKDMSIDFLQEQDANAFARFFLAPPRVLKKLHIKTAEDIKRYTLLNDELSKVQAIDCRGIKGELTQEESILLSNFNGYIESQTIRSKTKKKIIGITVGAIIICAVACAITFNATVRFVQGGKDLPVSQPTAAPVIEGDGVVIKGVKYRLDMPVYRAASNTDVFHKEGCSYIADKNNLTETTIQTAIDAGFQPCTRCFQ